VSRASSPKLRVALLITTATLIAAGGLWSLTQDPAGPDAEPGASPHRATRLAAGGIPMNITCTGVSDARFEQAMADLDAQVVQLGGALTVHRPDSPLGRFNAGPPGEYEIPAPAREVLDAAARLRALTGGAFDPAVRPLIDLWARAERRDSVPGAQEIEAARALVGGVGYRLTATALVKELDGVGVDLGALAKGYMADEAVALLVRAGCARVIVEFGGDVALARAPGQPPFRIGIRDPGGADALFGVLEVARGAVVTSGSYERGVTIGGRRYGHIVDPRTGRPVDELVSVTVEADDAQTADAVATALFVMGITEGRAFLDAHPEFSALMLAKDGRRVAVNGIEARLQVR
jgi:FAD:protein FMN transferase